MKNRWILFAVFVGLILMWSCKSESIAAYAPNPRDVERINVLNGSLSDELFVLQMIDIEFTVSKMLNAQFLSHILVFEPTKDPWIHLRSSNKIEFESVHKRINKILKEQNIEVLDEFGAKIGDSYIRIFVLKIDVSQDKAEWNNVWRRIFSEYPMFFQNIRVEKIITMPTEELLSER